MSTQRIETRFAPTAIDDAGRFSGYGAVFSNRDSHGDVIIYGAFRASLAEWKARGRLPKMMLMHGSNGNPFMGDDLPIGVYTDMREDSHGLYVEGKLLALDTDMGRRIRSLMLGGALDGLSIGYRVTKSAPGRGDTKRWIEELKLLEVSLVDEPSNDLARVSTIKALPPQVAADDAFERLRAAIKDMKTTAPAPTSDTPYDRLQAALRGLE